MVGVDMTKKGAQEYYSSLLELYAEWGVDYIKADDMSHPYHAEEIEALSWAIKGCSKDIVLSLSPGPAPLEQAPHLVRNAHLWRISGDFWDHWPLLKNQFDLCHQWSTFQQPNNWPDADMLPVGKLRITGPDDYVARMMKKKPEEITNEFSRLTRVEQVSMMSLWCIFRSPLMIGGHLPENDSFTLSLLTNRSLLDLNQIGINNREVFFSNDWVVWTAGRPGSNDQYVAIFNLDDHGSRTLKLEWSVLGLKGKYQVIDLWANEPLGQHQEELFLEAEPHGSRMIHLIASDRE
jgi:hypothetical protein